MKELWIKKIDYRYSRYLTFTIVVLLSSYLYSYNFFSPILRSDKLNVTNSNQVFKLKDSQLIINSETVYNDSITFPKEKYELDYKKGEIIFFQSIGIVTIEYQVVPENVKEKMFLYQTQVFTDSVKVRTVKKQSLFSNDTNLNITGSKTISVSVANNEDFSLDQSLYLKLNGEMSSNLNIEAQLSDSQSPITPEGDSREISSLDKIFLRLYGRQYDLAFGDLEMEFRDTEFINYSPKFEGLKAAWFDEHEAQGALAISKGKHTTINFAGFDGKQGPYYLSTEYLLDLLVVPGSEEVFLNGTKMQRGGDYTIDYSEGSVTFSNAHFISANSQIQVSFQYSDENYRQNMYLASSKVNITDKIQIANFMIIQNDDKNNPLQEELSKEDIDILEAAGDKDGWGSGITAVEDGLYILLPEDYYEYVGNDTTVTGNYNIHFEYIGSGAGDYNYDTIGDYYVYEGTGEGDYLPIRKLTAPQYKANYDLYAKYETDELLLKTEGILSRFDMNTYSAEDDGDNNGLAADLTVNYEPDLDKIKPQMELQYKVLGDNLNTFTDLNSAVQNYEFEQIPDTLASSSYSGKFSLNLFEYYQPELVIKRTTAVDFADQNFISLALQINSQNKFPTIYHRYFKMNQKYEDSLNDEYNVEQHQLNISQNIEVIKFTGDVRYKESKRSYLSGLENIIKYKNLKLKLETVNQKQINSNIHFQYDENKISAVGDTLDLQSTLENKHSYSAGGDLQYNTDQHRLDLSYSWQRVVNEKQNNEKDFNLASLSTSDNFLKRAININTNYSLKNVEFYPKIKELIYVGENNGAFNADSTDADDGIGDYNWEIVSVDYDNPQMSVELNAGTTLNLKPELITENFLSRFRSEILFSSY